MTRTLHLNFGSRACRRLPGHLDASQSVVGRKGNGNMFDQMNHEALGKKSLKEKLIEGAIILAVVGAMIGIMLYALEMA